MSELLLVWGFLLIFGSYYPEQFSSLKWSILSRKQYYDYVDIVGELVHSLLAKQKGLDMIDFSKFNMPLDDKMITQLYSSNPNVSVLRIANGKHTRSQSYLLYGVHRYEQKISYAVLWKNSLSVTIYDSCLLMHPFLQENNFVQTKIAKLAKFLLAQRFQSGMIYLKELWHGRKWLHLFVDSEACHEQMGPIPSSNESLDIALFNSHT